jgi:hypothetical protein
MLYSVHTVAHRQAVVKVLTDRRKSATGGKLLRTSEESLCSMDIVNIHSHTVRRLDSQSVSQSVSWTVTHSAS